MSVSFNKTFGILSGGTCGIRSTNVTPSPTQKKLLEPLWRCEPRRDLLAEFLIRFLRCSERWPEYCEAHDSLNTYHIPTDLDGLSIKFSDIIQWADECQTVSEHYKSYPHQTAIDRISNKLFGVLTVK